MQKGMERFLGTIRTRSFLGRLACGEYDGNDIAVVMSTSYPVDAERARSQVRERGLETNVLVLEYDDVENAQRPTAFTKELAERALSFAEDAWASGKALLFACDGARSRSAALMCAVMRILGLDDTSIWTQPGRYAPNILVYQLVLEAGGVHLDDSQILAHERLIDAGMFCRVHKGTMNVVRVDEPAFRQAIAGAAGRVPEVWDGPDIVIGDAITFIALDDLDKIAVIKVLE